MRKPFEQLLCLLQEETALYRDLVESLREEHRRLVNNETERLVQVARRKETLLLQARSLEESRLLLIDRFAAALQRPSEEITVALLAGYAPADLRESLLAARDALKTTFLRVVDLNDRNKALAESGLSLVHGLLERIQSAMTRDLAPSQAYGPARGGSPRAPASGGMIVRQRA